MKYQKFDHTGHFLQFAAKLKQKKRADMSRPMSSLSVWRFFLKNGIRPAEKTPTAFYIIQPHGQSRHEIIVTENGKSVAAV